MSQTPNRLKVCGLLALPSSGLGKEASPLRGHDSQTQILLESVGGRAAGVGGPEATRRVLSVTV